MGGHLRAHEPFQVTEVDVDVVLAELGLRGRCEDRRRQPGPVDQSGRQRHAAHRPDGAVVLQPGSGEVATGDTLDRHHVEALAQERSPPDRTGVVGENPVFRYKVPEPLEPPHRQGGQHPPLVRDRRSQHMVVGRDPVRRHDEQCAGIILRLVEIPDLPRVHVPVAGQLGCGHARQRSYRIGAGLYAAASGCLATTSWTRRMTSAVWAPAAPVNSIGLRTMSSRSRRSSPRRGSRASRSSRSLSTEPLRRSRATSRACSLITSWAVSRPMPPLTAAINTFVVARNGKERSSSRAITAGYAPNSSSTVMNVSNSPSTAKKAPGRATRRTTEQETSPSFHWAPASSAAIDA